MQQNSTLSIRYDLTEKAKCLLQKLFDQLDNIIVSQNHQGVVIDETVVDATGILSADVVEHDGDVVLFFTV